MKNIIYFILASSLFIGCIKGNKNGELDGMWQLQHVEFIDGRINKPFDHYLNIELKLLQFQSHNGVYLGRFQYTGDSLKVQMLEGNSNFLNEFGINDLNENMGITISSSKMILKTGYSTAYYRKW